MKSLNVWKLSFTYPNGSRVVRFHRSSSLSLGSAYGVDVLLPKDYPALILKVDQNGLVVSSCAGAEVESSEGNFALSLAVLGGGFRVEVENVTKSHQPLVFEATRAVSSDVSEIWTIWHYVGSVLLETDSVESCVDPSKSSFCMLRSGVQVQWQNLDSRLILKMPSGEIKSLKSSRSDKGSYLAKFGDDTFVMCRASGKDAYQFLPKDYAISKDPFNKYLLAFLTTWFLIIGLLNFGSAWLPDQIDPDLVAQEELPELMKKVEIAKRESKNSKETQGGNNMAGGGGVNTEARDPRGGGGFVNDEVVVADMQSLSGGSGIFDALGALDKEMAAKGVQTASLGPSNATASSILGALGALGGGTKKGGGGLGLGGVGTKGFGGGGGGGTGSGFGNGTGTGLGLGSGQRRLSFETGDSEIRGGLDRSEVDAVVRQNIAQIRFCYNRGLRSHPDLAGRVTSSFVINGDGKVKVSNIKQSSLGVAAVEDCIKDKVAMWAFPKPRGGGDVTVSYPFLLRAN